MAVLSGVDEAGAPALYDIPDGELSKYKLNLKPMTDEVRNRLFPGKDKLTKDDAQGVVPAGRATSDEHCLRDSGRRHCEQTGGRRGVVSTGVL